ncbi:MAG: hypothetical protein K2K10_09015, partial [Acetatifactor sp.]|nr:hypothetical protein [Acetatifactor sp.]
AKTIAEADTLAADNAILAAQKIAVRGLNGGISAGIKEVISANGAASTVANVRAKMDVPVVRKEDMQLTHKDARYAYTGSCDRMITSVDNKLVSVTTWNGSKLTYVEPTDPVIDRGIPTDENYDKYVNDGDDMGILLFEKTDQGLHRYMDDVKDAQAQAKSLIVLYEKARTALKEAQEKFDQIYDEGMTSEEVLPEEISEDSVLEEISEDSVLEEPDKIDVADKSEEAAEIDVASEADESEQIDAASEADESDKADEAAEKPLTAHEALLAIFGDDGME